MRDERFEMRNDRKVPIVIGTIITGMRMVMPKALNKEFVD